MKDPYVLKNELLAARYDEFANAGYADYLKVNSDIVKRIKVYGEQDYNTFFGYYDLEQVSPDGIKMLVLKVAKNALPATDEADIYYIDLLDDSWHFISKSKAWCWQQGCRLRWLPNSNSRIIYNDMEDGKYVSKVWDIDENKMIAKYPYAFYDIDFQTNIGIGLDFARLQTMRPGYGYSSVEDISMTSSAPDKGIYIYDLHKGNYNEIISLKDLAMETQSNSQDYHYINHICISPNHDRFMFFHLWAKDGVAMWNMRLLVSDYEGNYKELENKDIISHYCWLNNKELMVTKIVSENNKCFVIYDIETGMKRVIDNPYLVQDGHPVLLSNHKNFVVDTYPLENCIQKLFISSIENSDEYIEILSAFSDPRLFIEHRCDMHPRVHRNNSIISIDSTYSDGVRKCILLELDESLRFNSTYNEVNRY